MKINLQTVALLLTIMGLCLSGCTGLVKASVETQPRVEFSEKDYGDFAVLVEGRPLVYRLQASVPGKLDPDLIKYAPVIVQGFQSQEAEYDEKADAIGYPYLVNNETVEINTEQPAVFSRVEYTKVLDTRLKQLVYVFWYPERPVGSLEKGKIDGNILRITLDQKGQPAVLEYTQTCGCFHGVFAEEHLEAWAREEFKAPLDGKMYALEKKQPEKSDWVIRDLVRIGPDEHPVLFISAGKHFCRAIQGSGILRANSHLPYQEYSLEKYEDLSNLKNKDGSQGSMFNDEGLVLGAKRWKEELVLNSLINPGWPRHLDHMLIHWDEAHWTQPDLLTEFLRLPHNIVKAEPKEQDLKSLEVVTVRPSMPLLDQSIRNEFAEHKPLCRNCYP